MWSWLRITARGDSEVYSSIRELMRSTSKVLILFTCGIYLGWYLLATEDLPVNSAVGFFLVTVLVVLSGAVPLWMLSRWLTAAQITWLTGLAAAITLSVYVSQQPEVAFLYALLPLVAVVVIGWPAGVIAECALIVLVRHLAHSSAVPPPEGGQYLLIVASGAFTGLVGWAMARSLLTACQWSLFSFEQARIKVEEARDQRAELKQAQQDLILLNRELARLSDRLGAMQQLAEEARRAKEQFVANVSHELRTPLNMIIGFSEVIMGMPQMYGAKLPFALLADIAAIHRNGQHLAKLVDDVLDLSQVEAGRMALSKEWSCLQEIVEEAAFAVRALLESKGLQLEIAVPSDLPLVFCDSTRIRQVILNLLSNAGRFTEHGGVRIAACRGQDEVVVSVSDTGPGIAPEDQKSLFEPFRQLGLAGRRDGGSGLGLSISRQFVEMHGGRMWLESQVGLGTAFSFALPLAMASPAASARDGDMMRWFSPYHRYEARSRPSKAPVPNVTPRFVLLEHGDTLQRLVHRYLDDVQVVSARDVEDAVRAVSESPAQALIINAPPQKQTSVAPEGLSNLPYGTPVITCWVPGADDAAQHLGVATYLTKPVTHEALLSALSRLGDARSVLFVDDEPEVLQLFTRMLGTERRHYRIRQTTSGRRALALLRQHHPDAVVLDLMMPEMDGFEVLREKSQDPSIQNIPVIVVSSKDPAGQPILSDGLTVTRGGRLTAQDLLGCIQALTSVLCPQAKAEHRVRRETPDG